MVRGHTQAPHKHPLGVELSAPPPRLHVVVLVLALPCLLCLRLWMISISFTGRCLFTCSMLCPPASRLWIPPPPPLRALQLAAFLCWLLVCGVDWLVGGSLARGHLSLARLFVGWLVGLVDGWVVVG